MNITRRALIAAQLDVMTPAETIFVAKYNEFAVIMNALLNEWRDKGTWNRKNHRAAHDAWKRMEKCQWWRTR